MMESMLYSNDMSKNLFPEAVRTSPGEAIKLSAWAGVAVIVSLLSRWWLAHQADWNAAVRAGIALAPMVPSLLWARCLVRWMRKLDEMQRRMQYEAWLFALAGTVFVLTALGLIQSAGVFRYGRIMHGLGWEGAFALMFLLYCLGCAICNRRYT
jgi:hypothetical protein